MRYRNSDAPQPSKPVDYQVYFDPSPAEEVPKETLLIRPNNQQVEVPPQDKLVIGRSPGCNIHLDDKFVSMRHAKLYCRPDGQIRISDLGSANGVYRRLQARTPYQMTDRDRILLGQHLFRFEYVVYSRADEEERWTVKQDKGTLIQGSPGPAALARLIKRLTSGEKGKEYFLSSRPTVLGRDGGQINFPHDEHMSSRHAGFQCRQTRDGVSLIYVSDLDSRNGTWIQVRGEGSLNPGDVIRIGEHQLTVTPMGLEEEDPTALEYVRRVYQTRPPIRITVRSVTERTTPKARRKIGKRTDRKEE